MSTRMMTKFELPEAGPRDRESGVVAIAPVAITAVMPAYESAKLLAASVPTPSVDMKPLLLEDIAPPPPPPPLATLAIRGPTSSGAWQAAVLSVALSATLMLAATIVSAVLF